MKTLHTNSRYMRKHVVFFIFMMSIMLMLFGKASAWGFSQQNEADKLSVLDSTCARELISNPKP